MTQFRIPSWLFPVVVVTLLVASYSVYKRNQVETSNRATSIAVEYETVESLAAAQGATLDAAFEDLKAQGVNSVVLSEDTVGELVGLGQITISQTSVATGPGEPPVRIASLRFIDPSVFPRVQRGLQIRFGELAGNLAPRGDVLTLPPVSVGLVRTTSIGLDPNQAAMVTRHKLAIIARAGNPSGVSAASVKATLEWEHELGASVFLPEGDQVLGRRDALQTTIDTLKELHMLYATPEFSKIGGDENVVQDAPDNVVRLHSAQVAELDKLSPAEAVERYVKAARERQMRIVLVRPLSAGADKPLADFDGFIKDIGDGIRTQGGEIGAPKPFSDPHLPKAYFLVLGLLGAGISYGVVAAFFTDRRVRAVAGVLLALLGLACWIKTGQQLMALTVSIAFPILAFLAIDAYRPPKLPELVRILIPYVAASLISLVGGLYVAGLLNGLPYYVKAEEFKGIKVSVFVPVVAIGAMWMFRLMDWRGALKSAITWGIALLSFVLLGAFAFMLARTGNDSGVGASGGEMELRGFLERVLYIRPRTKEFLVGHPALIVGLGMLFRYAGRPRPEGEEPENARRTSLLGWTALVLTVGAVGQTSIVNTLCHLHIPVMISVVRVLYGVVLGCIVGSILWLVAGRLLPKAEI